MAAVKSIQFLPEIFRTDTNKKFLNATVDQLISDPQLKKINGYIGRKLAPSYKNADNYILESTDDRQNYQLEPSLIIKNPITDKIEFSTTYTDLINQINYYGGLPNKHDRLFNSEYYSYDPKVDLDKLINFSQYYWLENGPDAVTVSALGVPLNYTFNVVYDSVAKTYSFTGQDNIPNPTITLARGGTYDFVINEPESPFYIQGRPGTSGYDTLNPNINTREILGVSNNGTDFGVIRFIVPAELAQDQWNGMPLSGTADYATQLSYKDIQGATIEELYSLGGLDGAIASLFGKYLIFVNNSLIDDEFWNDAPAVVADGAVYFDYFDIAAFDSVNSPYDHVEYVPIGKRNDIYQIQILPDSTGVERVVLLPAISVDDNQKIKVRAGDTFSGKEFYSNSGLLEPIPYISANLNQLYYQNSTVGEAAGSIRIIDPSAEIIDPDLDIVGKVNYTSPQGIIFTNGLKVLFDSTATDAYQNKIYYVEGVGKSIRLILADNLTADELNGNLETPDYLTVNRASIDQNAWSRSNRWFHSEVIQKTADYLNTTVSFNQNLRAKRPIIEFEADLQLYNFGTLAKSPIQILDSIITNAYTQVQGIICTSTSSHTFTVNGSSVTLTNGDRVVFSIDNNNNVRDKIFVFSIVQESISPVVYKAYIEEAPDTTVEAGHVLIVQDGDNGGKQWYYNGTSWVSAQQKIKINQHPLFDIVDNNGISLAGTSTYPGSSFLGTKIFSYKIGTGANDPVLGFPLSYKNFLAQGDIEFVNNYDTDTFEYVTNKGTSGSIKTNSGLLQKNLDRSTSIRQNIWTIADNFTKQFQIYDFVYDGATCLFPIDNLPDISIDSPNIKVYVNNKIIATNNFAITKVVDRYAVVVNQNILTTNDVIFILLYNSIEDLPNAYYEIPTNLDINGQNVNLNTLTLGQMRNHLVTIRNKSLAVIGDVPGNSNLRDIPYISKGGSILQHSAPVLYSSLFLTHPTMNFVNALKLANHEYSKFKIKFLELAANLELDRTNIANCVDLIIGKINELKNNSFPWYYSDMVPYASMGFNEIAYTILSATIRSYEISNIFQDKILQNKAVLVYLTRTVDTQTTTLLLVKNKDFYFDQTRPAITFYDSFTLLYGDKITIVEYSNTDGSYIPETPTKLGTYPKFIPEIFTDTTYREPVKVIQGHDGSITPCFNDYRDDILLELERRIYNNLKVEYNPNNFNLYDYIPGKFRNTGYTNAEFNQVISSAFYSWVGSNKVDYTTNNTFKSSDPFTWNYKNFRDIINGETLPGTWRSIYRYFYDTDRPHTHPWEMLGFSEKPNYWNDRYGPAPYTGGNAVLWSDLSQGYIHSGSRAGFDIRYRRPNLNTYVPVDDSGNLVSPEKILVVDFDSNRANTSYAIGDSGPAETAWRRSSEYPFALNLALALTRPAKYFSLLSNITNYYRDSITAQFLIENTGQHLAPGLILINGLANGSTVERSAGYINWIVDYVKNLGIDDAAYLLKDNLSKLSIQLAYKIGGYTDKKFITLLAEQSSPTSVNDSIVIPDENYRIELYKSTPINKVQYSAVIIEKSQAGYTVSGYSTTNPYFFIIPSLPNNNSYVITQGNLRGVIYKDYQKVKLTVPYGFEFNTKQQVVDFLVSYQRYLIAQGFIFTDVDYTLNEKQDWILSAKEFLHWVSQGWRTGSILVVTPVKTTIKFYDSSAVIDEIKNIPFGSRILDISNKVIKKNNFTVYRENNLFTIQANADQSVGFAELNVVQYEHLLILDNQTVFNDVIYAPELGNRQYRLKLLGSRTDNWNGSLELPGFIYSSPSLDSWKSGTDYLKGTIVEHKSKYYTALQNVVAADKFQVNSWKLILTSELRSGMINNFATNASQGLQFYDIDNQPYNEELQLFSNGLIGFRDRKFFSDLGIDTTTQSKFYQGLIKQKGTLNSIIALKGAKFNNINTDINIYENWAVRVGEYGSLDDNQYVEIALDETQVTNNPTAIQFVDSTITPEADIVTYSFGDLYKISGDWTPNLFRTKSIEFTDTITPLPVAGYVYQADIDSTLFNLDNYQDINQNLDIIGTGWKLWVARNFTGEWDVLRANIVHGITFAIRYSIDSDAEFIHNEPHDLAVDDIVIIKNFDSRFNGAYKVKTIIDSTRFTVELYQNLKTLVDLQAVVGQGMLYKLTSMRISYATDIETIKPKQGWVTNDKIWVDNLDNDQNWGVYSKTDPWNYDTKYTLNESQLAGMDHFGSTLSLSSDGQVVYSAAPDSGTGKVAVFQNNTVTDKFSLVASLLGRNSDLSYFGGSLSNGNNFLAVGAHKSYSDRGLVYIFKDQVLQQILIEPTGSSGDQFGYSSAMSANGKFLYVGAPGANKVYCYGLAAERQPSAAIYYGDGVSVAFTLPGTVEDATSVVVYNPLSSTELTPLLDYTTTSFTSGVKKYSFSGIPVSTLGNSSTFLTIGTGTKTLTVSCNLSYSSRLNIQISYNSSNVMKGTISSYNYLTGALVVNVTSIVGSGSYSLWTTDIIELITNNGTAGPYTLSRTTDNAARISVKVGTSILAPFTGYTTAGNQLTLAAAPNIADSIEVSFISNPYYNVSVTGGSGSGAKFNVAETIVGPGVFTAFIVGKTYKIATAGTTDFVAIGAADNNPGTIFVATGTGIVSGSTLTTGTAYTYDLTLSNAGTGYVAGNTLTISGANIGGVSPINDISISVQSSADGKNIIFTSIPSVAQQYQIILRSYYYQLIETLPNNSEAAANSNFGYSISCNLEGTSIVVGAPDEVVGTYTSSGAIYLYHRTVDEFITNGISGTFTLPHSFNAIRSVALNNVELTENVDYYIVGSSVQFTPYNTPAKAQRLTIESNLFVFDQRLAKLSGQNHNFGSHTDFCSTGCNIVVSAPNYITTDYQSGAVARIVNVGRLYGSITGTVTNPTVTPGHSLSINNVTVKFLSSTLTSVISAINAANIPGVTAENIDNKLKITSQVIVPGQKLDIKQGTGTPFADLGIELYQLTQIIRHPEMIGETFGTAVALNAGSTVLAVSSQGGDITSPIIFENGNTTFDAASTNFSAFVKDSGSVYVYDLISNPFESINSPSIFASSQKLYGPELQTGCDFGQSVRLNNNSLFVGVANDIEFNSQETGSIYYYRNRTGSPGWNLTRYKQPRIDVDAINSVFTYDSESAVLINYFDFIDPAKGKLLGAVDQELDFKEIYDPASYNLSANNSVIKNSNFYWTDRQVGKTWWDLSLISFIDYEQDSLAYRVKNWGAYFPGSQVKIYEWVKSAYLPSQYVAAGGDGIPKYVDDSAYSLSSTVDPVTGIIIQNYYYWVGSKTTVNSVIARRNLSTKSLESYILNPKDQGIPYVALVAPNSFAIYNTSNNLRSNKIVLHLDLGKSKEQGLIHGEFELIQEGNGLQVFPQKIIDKMRDSLAGFDSQGSVVPDVNLNVQDRYGLSVKPRQSIFIDRLSALRIFVKTANSILYQYPILLTTTPTTLYAESPLPTSGFDAQVDSATQLSYLNENVLEDGYRVLVPNDPDYDNKWTIYEYKGATSSFQIYSIQSFKTPLFWTLLDWYASDYDLGSKIDFIVPTYGDIQSVAYVAGDLIKVLDNGNGQWLIYQVLDDLSLNLRGAQNATLQIDQSVYDVTLGSGFDTTVFETTGFDPQIGKEFVSIYESIHTEIFIKDLAIQFNELFFAMVNFLFSEQKSPDWIFKTSFIDAYHNLRKLEQIPNYVKDDQTFYENYINEIKPYRTKLRDYLPIYDAIDTATGDWADFDLPSVYNSETGTFAAPTDSAILSSTSPYTEWYNHYPYMISDFIIGNVGIGYGIAPNVEITGGGGYGATAIATINPSTQKITGVIVTNPGSGYTSTPTITINGIGTGAIVYPLLKNQYFEPDVSSSYNLIRTTDTTLKFDRILYTSTVTVWQPNVAYPETVIASGTGTGNVWVQSGSIISYQNEPFKAKSTTYSTTNITWKLTLSSNITANIGDYITQFVGNTGNARVLASVTNANVVDVDFVGGNIKLAANIGTRVNIANVVSYTTTTANVVSMAPRTVFDYTLFERIDSANVLLTATDRIKVFYQPGVGMPNNNFAELMAGIDYPGAKVTAARFTANSFEISSNTVSFDYIGLTITSANIQVLDFQKLGFEVDNSIRIQGNYDFGFTNNGYFKIISVDNSYMRLSGKVIETTYRMLLNTPITVYSGDIITQANTLGNAYVLKDATNSKFIDIIHTTTGFQQTTSIGTTAETYPVVTVGSAENIYINNVLTVASVQELTTGGNADIKISYLELDTSILDSNIYSKYLDTALGTRPEDINIEGGAYVDTYNSHAPEELVPGHMYDALEIRVFSNNTANTATYGFRIFHPMNENPTFTRISANNTTTLSKDLNLTDRFAFVNDINTLPAPNSNSAIPGVVYINGERIHYYQIYSAADIAFAADWVTNTSYDKYSLVSVDLGTLYSNVNSNVSGVTFDIRAYTTGYAALLNPGNTAVSIGDAFLINGNLIGGTTTVNDATVTITTEGLEIFYTATGVPAAADSITYQVLGNIYANANSYINSANIQMVYPNTISQLRRSVDGTGAPATHAAGSLVVDSSLQQGIPNSGCTLANVYAVDNLTVSNSVTYKMSLTDPITANLGEYITQFSNANVRVLDSVTNSKIVAVSLESIDITSYAWRANTLSVANNLSISAQDTTMTDVFFKSDGTKMYSIGSSGDKVYEYTLGRAWNVATASNVAAKSVSTQETGGGGLFFKPDGTKMYIIGSSQDRVFEYTLSTPWRVNTASNVGTSVQTSSGGTSESSPQAIFFRPDGSSYYIVGTGADRVMRYDMTTPWQVNTAAYYSQSSSITSIETSPIGLSFHPDGKKMFVVGSTNDRIREYDLATAWDPSTITLVASSPILSGASPSPQGIFWKPDGTRVFVVDSTLDQITAYDVATSTYTYVTSSIPVVANAAMLRVNVVSTTSTIRTTANILAFDPLGTITANGNITTTTIVGNIITSNLWIPVGTGVGLENSTLDGAVFIRTEPSYIP